MTLIAIQAAQLIGLTVALVENAQNLGDEGVS